MSQTLNQTIPPPPTAARRRRGGCTGCILQCTLVLVLAALGVVAIDALFAPYIFTMGGSFHPYPWWSGVGKMHTSSGDYAVYVNVFAWRKGQYSSPLRGSGIVCTPKGETFNMKVYGDIPRRVWSSVEGQPMSLDFMHQTWNYGFTNDHRPEFRLHGVWHGPNLVMDDHGSLTRAFLPDGTAYMGSTNKQPESREVVPVTLTSGSKSEFEAACATLKH